MRLQSWVEYGIGYPLEEGNELCLGNVPRAVNVNLLEELGDGNDIRSLTEPNW